MHLAASVLYSNRDFKIVDNGRLGRLDACTGDFKRVREKGAKFFKIQPTRP